MTVKTEGKVIHKSNERKARFIRGAEREELRKEFAESKKKLPPSTTVRSIVSLQIHSQQVIAVVRVLQDQFFRKFPVNQEVMLRFRKMCGHPYE